MRVLGPRPAGVDVGDAAPEVDDLLALHVQRERRADLPVLLEVVRERLLDSLEPRCDFAVDVCHGPSPVRVGEAATIHSRYLASTS